MRHLEARSPKARVAAYSLAAIGSLIAGFVPLAHAVFIVAAMVVADILVLRQALLWLPLGRRIAARTGVRLLGAGLGCANFVINVLVAPFPGISAFVLAFVGPIVLLAYVETGSRIVAKRLRWEAERKPFGVSEWRLPALLLAGLFMTAALSVLVPVALVHLLARAHVPLASSLASWVLSS
jgi:hypothetical protein